MPCDPSVFEDIPIFSLLDADEGAVLAEQVEQRRSEKLVPVHTHTMNPAPGGWSLR